MCVPACTCIRTPCVARVRNASPRYHGTDTAMSFPKSHLSVPLPRKWWGWAMAEGIKGAESQAPPQDQNSPCRPLLPHVAHSLSRQSLPPKPTGQSQLKPPQRSEQKPLFLHGFELQKCSLAWQPGRGRHMEDMRHGVGHKCWTEHRGSEGPKVAMTSVPCSLRGLKGWTVMRGEVSFVVTPCSHPPSL